VFSVLDLCVLTDDVDTQAVPMLEWLSLGAVSAGVSQLSLGPSPSPTVADAFGFGPWVIFGTQGEVAFFLVCTWTGAFFFKLNSSFCSPSLWGSEEEEDVIAGGC
jgi:hypothetical protein